MAGTYYIMMNPDSKLDYTLNLACTDNWLAEGDTISTATWTSLSALITVTSSSTTTTTVTVWLQASASAVEGETYEVKCQYVTVGGRRDYRHLRVVIRER